MAAFNLSITLGGSTRSRNGTASAAHLTRFVAALRVHFPKAGSDDEAVDRFLDLIVDRAKTITLDIERNSVMGGVSQIDVT